jgi:hypothetical protein
MSGRINNKSLLYVLIGLVAVLVITRLLTREKSVRTLETELVRIDTSQITSILLYPRAETGEEIVFEKANGQWIVSSKGVEAPADPNSILRSLTELLNLKTERLVARSKERWGEYQVGDSLSTRVIIREGKKKTLDLVIGRFDYQPPANQYPGYQQNQFSGVSYVRKQSEDEVYAVEGFLGLSFNQGFNSWRDQTVTNLNQELISRLVFDYPADSGFIAQKSETGWTVAGLPADSTSMVQYLRSVSRKRSSAFKDGFQPSKEPDYQLTIEGDNMQALTIRGYRQPGGDVILNSSSNPDSWFNGSTNDLFGGIYKVPGDLLPEALDTPE